MGIMEDEVEITGNLGYAVLLQASCAGRRSQLALVGILKGYFLVESMRAWVLSSSLSPIEQLVERKRRSAGAGHAQVSEENPTHAFDGRIASLLRACGVGGPTDGDAGEFHGVCRDVVGPCEATDELEDSQGEEAASGKRRPLQLLRSCQRPEPSVLQGRACYPHRLHHPCSSCVLWGCDGSLHPSEHVPGHALGDLSDRPLLVLGVNGLLPWRHPALCCDVPRVRLHVHLSWDLCLRCRLYHLSGEHVPLLWLWFMLEYGYKETLAFKLNGIALVVFFFIFRIFIGCPYSFIFWTQLSSARAEGKISGGVYLTMSLMLGGVNSLNIFWGKKLFDGLVRLFRKWGSPEAIKEP
eukprot:755266-Hanusia_phi.AAC.2